MKETTADTMRAADSPSSDAKNPKENGDISFLDILAILWKRKKMIIGVTGIAAIFIVAFSLISLLLPPEKSFLPNLYSPKATILISAGGSGSFSSALASSGLSGLASLAGISAGNNTNGLLAIELLKSNTILDSLDAKFHFAQRNKAKKTGATLTREMIKGHLKGAFSDKTNILTITFDDIDPVFAQDVVNTTVQMLGDRFASLGGNKAIAQRDLLEKKLADIDVSVKNAEAKIIEFQKNHGTINVQSLASEQIALLAGLRSQMIMKEMEISEYQKISKIEDPFLVKLRSERESILSKINELETGKGAKTRIMPSQQEMPLMAFEYQKLERELLVQTELFRIMTQQYELAKLNAAGQDPVYQIIELADVPDKKSGPSRARLCMLVTLSAFFIALVLAMLMESMADIKSDPEKVARFRKMSARGTGV